MPNESTTKLTLDVSDLKKNIQEANRQIRLANAEFKASASSMDDWSKSADGLSDKIGALKKVLDAQKTILSAYREQLERTEAAYGKNSKEADEMRIKIANQQAVVNKTTKELEGYERELRDLDGSQDAAAKSADKLGDEIDETGEQAKNAEGGFTILKGAMANLAATAITAVVNGLKEMGEAMVSTIKDAAGYVDDINTMSTVTGIATDKLQEMTYMADLMDVSVDSITGSMSKLTKNMATASKGTGDAAAAFEALGIEIVTADGSLRNNEDVFNEVIDALGRMENETQRDAYAMQIMGKSAQDLNPLIEAGSQRFNELAQEAHDMGYVIDSESMTALNDLNDTFDRLSAVGTGVKNQLAAAAAPIVNEFLSPIVEGLASIPQALKNGGIDGVIDTFGGIIETAIDKATEYLPKALEFGGKLLMKIGEGINKNLPSILSAGINMTVELVSSMTESLPTRIPQLVEFLLDLVDMLLDNVDVILEAGVKLAMGLVDGIIRAIPILVKKAPEIIIKTAKAITDQGHILLKAFAEMFVGLGDVLMYEVIPEVVGAFTTLFDDLFPGAKEKFDEFSANFGEWFGNLGGNITSFFAEVGGFVVNGLAGIWQSIKDFFQPLIDFIKPLLDSIKYLIETIFQAIGVIVARELTSTKEQFTEIWNSIVEFITPLLEAVKVFITTTLEGIREQFTTIWTNIQTFVQTCITAIQTFVTTAFNAMVSRITTPLNNIKSLVSNTFNGIKDIILGIIEKAKTWGADLLSNFISGVKSKVSAVSDTITGVADKIKDVIGFSEPKEGPLARFHTFAPDMVDLWNETLQKNTYKLEDQFKKSFDFSGMATAANNLEDAVGGVAGTGSGSSTTTNTYNFTQNNTSPKALSRLELYRQTKNQLDFAKGVI